MRVPDTRHGRWLERALLVAGVVCLTWAGVATVQRAAYKRAHEDSVESAAENRAATKRDLPPVRLAAGSVVGRLEIPRLAFSEIVAEGDDERTLGVAVGHLPDTPLPWAAGNSVLAGHRDTHFRALREIVIGDEMRLKTPSGTFLYQVLDKMIVSPADVWVLAPTPERRLTLVTCYPFSYVGPAPQRFIVKARAVGGP
jgi:sortase A